MLYHVVMVCRTEAHAQSLCGALSTRYKELYPALVPLACGSTSREQGFVVAQWHGELDEQALSSLRTDHRLLDLCWYAVPFFFPGNAQEETEDEEMARLFGPARLWEREDLR